jgi:hypothetical protein
MNKKVIWLIMLVGLIFNLFFPRQAYIGSFFIVTGAIFLIAGRDTNK